MTVTSQEGALQESLAQLETSLLSPSISGELLEWVANVGKATAELQPRLETYIQDVAHPQYKEIARSDNELLYRVEQAMADDQKLLEGLQSFCSELDSLTRRAPDALKDELMVASLRQDVEKRGTPVVLSIRKHELAVGEWLNEALFRDRGTPG